MRHETCHVSPVTVIWGENENLFLLVLTNFHFQDKALTGLSEWLSDPAVSSNPTLLLIAGMIYTHEQNYNEALKYTHVGGSLDL